MRVIISSYFLSMAPVPPQLVFVAAGAADAQQINRSFFRLPLLPVLRSLCPPPLSLSPSLALFTLFILFPPPTFALLPARVFIGASFNFVIAFLLFDVLSRARVRARRRESLVQGER